MERVGWLDRGTLSPHLFCTVTDHIEEREVVGIITDISESLSSSWANKFEQDNIDDKTPWSAMLQAGSMGQITDSDIIEAFKGRTHYTKAQTKQIWTGTSPLNISLTLSFVAFRNGANEVDRAISFLQQMTSPILKESLIDSYKNVYNETINSIRSGVKPDSATLDTILGYIPNNITLSMFENVYVTEYILMNVDVSDSSILRTKEGDRVAQSVSLSFESVQSLNKEDIVPLARSQIVGQEDLW